MTDINSNIIRGKWNEFKGEAQRLWGEITLDDLEKTKGDATAILGLVQQRIGHSQAEAKRAIQSIVTKLEQSIKPVAQKP